MSVPAVASPGPEPQFAGNSRPARSKAWRLIASMMLLVSLSYGCRTTAPAPPPAAEGMRGVASWYGEEFAGRTTANGEIFDPALLTAAHRTLPFGTVLDVTNPATRQKVRVRVNDRGPYIGGRVLDLSYAAAQLIGLIEPGVGEVELAVVRVGGGDREPPVPFEAIVAVAPTTASVNAGPAKPVPAPRVAVASSEPPNVEPVVDRVEVQIERAGVATRTQVAADGRTLEEVPVDGGPGRVVPANRAPSRVAAPARPAPAASSARKQFIVQVGAFSQEANARALQERLAAIGQRAQVDHQDLYRVRLGPFATRDEAVAARAALEANGLSAIIVTE